MNVSKHTYIYIYIYTPKNLKTHIHTEREKKITISEIRNHSNSHTLRVKYQK